MMLMLNSHALADKNGTLLIFFSVPTIEVYGQDPSAAFAVRFLLRALVF
jgi:hypothetical protein